MYRVSIQGVDERMINLHYYHYYSGQLQHSRSNRNHHCTSSPATTAPQVQLPLDLKSSYHCTSSPTTTAPQVQLPLHLKSSYHWTSSPATTAPQVQLPLDLKSNYHWTSNYHIVVSLMPHDAHLPAENKAAFTLCTNLA